MWLVYYSTPVCRPAFDNVKIAVEVEDDRERMYVARCMILRRRRRKGIRRFAVVLGSTRNRFRPRRSVDAPDLGSRGPD